MKRVNWVWLASLLSFLTIVPQVQAMGHFRVTEPTPYYRGYVAVADWLRTNTAPDASVALIEIGTIGYYSERPIVDTMGLVSPSMVGHLHSWEQTLLYALAQHWPEYAVALAGTAWDSVEEASWFHEAYAPVSLIPSAGPGSRTATIYKRAAGFPIRTFDLARSCNLGAGDAIALSAIRAQARQLQPGEVYHVQLEWRARSRTDHDHKVLIDLISALDGQRRSLAVQRPMRGGNPTFLWEPDEVIVDDYSLIVPVELAPGPYMLEVRLLNATANQLLGFVDSRGQAVRHATIGPLWVGAPELPSYRIMNAAQAAFGSSIELLGFDLVESAFAPGEYVPLTLYWTASEPIDDDYTVFVHVYDGGGNLIAQQDNPPLQGRFPTSLWLPGITLPDYYLIRLPHDLPAGQYSIKTGLYEQGTGQRLSPRSSLAEVQDRALHLAYITVH